jgi:hypothetical protein
MLRDEGLDRTSAKGRMPHADHVRDRLLTTSKRLAMLEFLAQDPATFETYLRDNRYLRLAAAIAQASEHVERARLATMDARGAPDRIRLN